jgi:hypothetical protein
MTYEKLPLRNVLRGKMLRIAELQDSLITELVSKFDFVLHGGTAIWRIYKGKRFSYDIDIYCADTSAIAHHFGKTNAFKMTRSKVTGSGVLYARFEDAGAEVEINASPYFTKVNPVDGEFRLVGGDSIILKTLAPEELLKEKISAFLDRRKARDLYDIFYLMDFADAAEIRGDVKNLARFLNAPPTDFGGIRELILLGKAPEFETIVRKVKMHA